MSPSSSVQVQRRRRKEEGKPDGHIHQTKKLLFVIALIIKSHDALEHLGAPRVCYFPLFTRELENKKKNI